MMTIIYITVSNYSGSVYHPFQDNAAGHRMSENSGFLTQFFIAWLFNIVGAYEFFSVVCSFLTVKTAEKEVAWVFIDLGKEVAIV